MSVCRSIVVSLFLVPLALAGCVGGLDDTKNMGDGDGGGGNNNSGYTRVDTGNPEIEAELNERPEVICESQLTVTGTFLQGMPRPANRNGCWAVGTWTLNATATTVGCSPQPTLPADFVYEVTFDEDAENPTDNVVFVNSPEDDRVNLKITAVGSDCQGIMDHFLPDFSVWSLYPVLSEDLQDGGEPVTVTGKGNFTVYDEDPF